MEGTLVLNLEPPYMGFEANKSSRQFRNCTTEEIRRLLVDLKVLAPYDYLPNTECMVNIKGTFPAEILSSYGLFKCRALVLGSNEKGSMTS